MKRYFLRHARRGDCKPDHIKMLRKLVLTNPECPPTDFSQGPWKDAVLVTPRHGVRIPWNEEAVRKHCRESGEVLFRCRAEDRVKERESTLVERWAVVTKPRNEDGTVKREKKESRRRGRKEDETRTRTCEGTSTFPTPSKSGTPISFLFSEKLFFRKGILGPNVGSILFNANSSKSMLLKYRSPALCTLNCTSG